MARILLVEDDHPTRAALERLLRLNGHRVTAVATAADAARHSRDEQPFDILISDILLPDGTGWDVLHTLRQTGKQPAVAVAITGSLMENETFRSIRSGFCAQLIKPVTFGKILEVIDRCVSAK